ncbi:MAG: putative ABC exporter domain-containing protein [Clostridiales bacterium]
MTSMIYLSLCKYKNLFKGLFKKPLFGIIFLIFLGFMIFKITTISRMGNINIITTESDKIKSMDVIISSIMIFIAFMFSMMVSRNVGMFISPEINIIFTAPIKKVKILIYSIYENGIFSLIGSFVIVIYLSMIITKISIINDFMVFLLILSTMYCAILIYLVIYLLSVKFKNINKYVSYFIYSIIFVIAIQYFFIFKENGDIFDSVKVYFESIYFNYIPMIGWSKFGIISAYKGNFIEWSIIFLINLAIIISAILFLIKSKIDFYENALSNAGEFQVLREKAKSGKFDINSYRSKKIESVESDFDDGAKALLYKQKLELKKTKYLFDKQSFIMGVVYIFLFSKLNILGENYSLYTVMIMLCILQVSISSRESWISEFKRPFIYLIPESSVKKAIYISSSKIKEYIITGIIFFAIIYFLQKPELITIIGAFLLFMSYKMLFLYAIFLGQRFVGIIESQVLTALIRILISYLVAIPSALGISVLLILKMNDISISLVGIILNIIMVVVVMFLSRRVFEVAEIND